MGARDARLRRGSRPRPVGVARDRCLHAALGDQRHRDRRLHDRAARQAASSGSPTACGSVFTASACWPPAGADPVRTGSTWPGAFVCAALDLRRLRGGVPGRAAGARGRARRAASLGAELRASSPIQAARAVLALALGALCARRQCDAVVAASSRRSGASRSALPLAALAVVRLGSRRGPRRTDATRRADVRRADRAAQAAGASGQCSSSS